MIRTPEQPESLPQSRNWDKRKNNFVNRGCCHTCAAQAAWAHQTSVGFARINPPCTTCRPIVDGFPLPTINLQWRTVPTSTRRALVSPLTTDLTGTRALLRVGTTPARSVPSERAA